MPYWIIRSCLACHSLPFSFSFSFLFLFLFLFLFPFLGNSLTFPHRTVAAVELIFSFISGRVPTAHFLHDEVSQLLLVYVVMELRNYMNKISGRRRSAKIVEYHKSW